MRNITATFADGHTSPVVVRGDYSKGLVSHILIGLTHNKSGYARVIFLHDNEPLGAKALEAYDPWIKDVHEHVTVLERIVS